MRSLLIVCALAGAAQAHISITSGPAIANKSQIITFGIGHGCTDANNKKLDTLKIKVIIPDGVTGVRAFRSDFGKPVVTKSGANVTSVEWTKPASELLDDDDGYYEIKIRAAIPNTPFAKLKFVVEQTCEDTTTHDQIVSNWDADEDSTTGEPAPQLVVVPAHSTGWTKITAARALTIEEVATYLGDATIVWKGSAAYSSNANTAAMIASTPGVTKLESVAANDELWVKY
jgi:uncharacterized protein YcnI